MYLRTPLKPTSQKTCLDTWRKWNIEYYAILKITNLIIYDSHIVMFFKRPYLLAMYSEVFIVDMI